MKSYKHSNGRIIHRSGNGRFKKTTMDDLGITNVNKDGIVFICNVCGRDFVPLVLSGHCCGVDDKRRKEVIIYPEEQAILDKIAELSGRPFISRLILNQIQLHELELRKIRQQKK